MADKPAQDPDFEAKVAALLKVDPEGITGQTAKGKRPKKPAPTPEKIVPKKS